MPPPEHLQKDTEREHPCRCRRAPREARTRCTARGPEGTGADGRRGTGPPAALHNTAPGAERRRSSSPGRCSAALLDRGMSARQIRRDVTAHVLVRVHPGFYVPSEQYRRLSPAERRRLKHEAFSRHAAAPPLYCLASAALMLGFDLRRPPEKLHVLALPGAGTRNGHGGVVRHEAEVPEEDMVYRDGVLTTTPERTLLDCARLLPFDDAVVLADQAARFHVSEGRLRQRLPEWAGRRGVRRAEAVLDTMEVRSESVAETLTRLLILGSHLPCPEVQWVVRGRCPARPDPATGGRVCCHRGRPTRTVPSHHELVGWDGTVLVDRPRHQGPRRARRVSRRRGRPSTRSAADKVSRRRGPAAPWPRPRAPTRCRRGGRSRRARPGTAAPAPVPGSTAPRRRCASRGRPPGGPPRSPGA